MLILLLLGMGAAFALGLVEEASPVYFAPWLRSLLMLVLAGTGVWGWYGWTPHMVFQGFGVAFIASGSKKILAYIEASADEKATAIVARRYARRGPSI